MAPSSWWRHALGAALSTAMAVVFVIIVVPSCTLPREGSLSSNCTADSECSVTDDCLEAYCTSDGFCADRPAENPELTDTDNDCERLTCVDGVTTPEVDDTDFAETEDCVSNARCQEGDLVEMPVVIGEHCLEGPLEGECQPDENAVLECIVACSEDLDCDDLNPCTDAFCDLSSGVGFCEFTDLDGVTAPSEVPGDCQLTTCVLGMVQNLTDDTQLPIDNFECTYDVCLQGIPSNPPLAPGDGCSGGGDLEVCDGAGNCVECVGAANCEQLAGQIDLPDCESIVCQNNGCAIDFAPAGTLLNPGLQVVGNCTNKVCNGAGAEGAPVTNMADVPADGNDCTNDECIGSTPQNNPVAQGSLCGVNGVCNNMGQCVGCNGPTDCGTNTDCYTWACNTGTCAQNFMAPGTLTSNQVAMNCLNEVCNGAGVPIQVPTNDPIVDGLPCTGDICTNGTPSNPALGINTSCLGTMWCDGLGACVQCNNPTQCSGAPFPADCEMDVCSAHVCGIGDQPAGTPAPGGYQMTGDCQLAVCDGAGNVSGTTVADNGDPPNDGIECTADTCVSGVPTINDKPLYTVCGGSGTTVCDGMGECKDNNGQPCSGGGTTCATGECQDGVCCNLACTGGCEICSGVAPWTVAGQCFGYIFTDPENQCSGQDVCNGAGVCGTCGVDSASGGACPVECTGGCSPANTCNILCDATDECRNATINCPAGFNCTLICNAGSACRDSILNCPNGPTCSVSCTANNGCRGLDVNCNATGGSCNVDCTTGTDVCRDLIQSCGPDGCVQVCQANPSGNVQTCNTSCGCYQDGC